MVWGVVAWVMAGWGLALWRRLRGAGEGADCLVPGVVMLGCALALAAFFRG